MILSICRRGRQWKNKLSCCCPWRTTFSSKVVRVGVTLLQLISFTIECTKYCVLAVIAPKGLLCRRALNLSVSPCVCCLLSRSKWSFYREDLEGVTAFPTWCFDREIQNRTPPLPENDRLFCKFRVNLGRLAVRFWDISWGLPKITVHFASSGLT